ncbi:hypothetical protein TTHERM_00845880 (macronuclear) [Tetrahymena thermophila SB210]|uniref:Uncharacterized protein n=1 Tax=Tetrahymena thermophila (strain SB210) TaxID=312017 RepID=Q22UU3_TETTS|nr:hypothetical protein TTHERM_00845880 [Tetrahymena thermophila SB210]EAR89033.2 hypothetical protein TTHERM_00845880 [Tetrahymena thermophila SB210]|eukprot:XP_001009278.2 hypothetical protein TTHERM_00845880 [Tetrahymena thermophila SB210]
MRVASYRIQKFDGMLIILISNLLDIQKKRYKVSNQYKNQAHQPQIKFLFTYLYCQERSQSQIESQIYHKSLNTVLEIKVLQISEPKINYGIDCKLIESHKHQNISIDCNIISIIFNLIASQTKQINEILNAIKIFRESPIFEIILSTHRDLFVNNYKHYFYLKETKYPKNISFAMIKILIEKDVL